MSKPDIHRKSDQQRRASGYQYIRLYMLFSDISVKKTRNRQPIACFVWLILNLLAGSRHDHDNIVMMRRRDSNCLVLCFIEIGGWKTESIAKYYIGATSSGAVAGSKRSRAQSYAGASDLPLSPAFEAEFAACVRT